VHRKLDPHVLHVHLGLHLLRGDCCFGFG
jgi:hypothetical protein